jgi:hypothetical protein
MPLKRRENKVEKIWDRNHAEYYANLVCNTIFWDSFPRFPFYTLVAVIILCLP